MKLNIYLSGSMDTDNPSSQFIFILILIGGLFALGEWLYYKLFAPCYTVKVAIISKGFSMGVKPSAYNSNRSGYYRYANNYWAEFQVVETNAVIKLGMDSKLYISIKEGQRGMLTYRKGYALSFQRMGTMKKRKLPLGERALDFFNRK